MSPHSQVILDEDALDRLMRIGGQDFVIEMIALFLDNAPRRVAAARAALDAGDFQALYRAAHSLKSTSANLGAQRLRLVAERVEAMAAAGGADGVGPLVEELGACYDQVQEKLDAERKRRTSPEP
jgi:two-component system, sensor histidine kinase and response regulator